METTRITTVVIQLFELSDGEVVGVRFPDWDAAADWEEAHDQEITGRGCVRLVTKTQALREAMV